MPNKPKSHRPEDQPRTPRPPRLRCGWCGVFKDDTAMREDPFAVELDDDYTLYPSCDDCLQTRHDDF